MKKIKTRFLICAMLLNFNGCYAQPNNDSRIILMLKEFYTAYSEISFRSEDIPKVDSLQEKYCTSQLRKEAKRYLQDGHDLLTDDWGISKESLSSMKITKDPAKEKTYIVSYIVDSYPVAPDKPVKKQVVLHITVVKEDELYKIDSVNSFE